MTPLILSALFAFVFGAIIGSFLNVVIYRVPADLSIVSPGSRCPSCQTPIAWHDNIPILSWLALGAQCRHCKTNISWRYPAIEALTGFLSALLWLKIAANPLQDLATLSLSPLLIHFSLHFIFICLLIVIAFVDLDHFIIPHEFTLPGILLGLASPFILLKLYPNEATFLSLWPPVIPMTAIVGMFLGAGIIIAIFLLYLTIRGVPGMGGGDVTLMALVGAWLGWPGVFFVLFAASIQGLIAAAFSHFTGFSLIKDAHEIFDEDEQQEAQDELKAKTKEDQKEGQSDDKAQSDKLESMQDDAQEEAPEDQEEAKTQPENSDTAEDNADHATQEQEAPESEAPAEPEKPRKKPVVIVLEDERAEEPRGALPAIPFGPFIVLSTLEHYFLGSLLPESISMATLYML